MIGFDELCLDQLRREYQKVILDTDHGWSLQIRDDLPSRWLEPRAAISEAQTNFHVLPKNGGTRWGRRDVGGTAIQVE